MSLSITRLIILWCAVKSWFTLVYIGSGNMRTLSNALKHFAHPGLTMVILQIFYPGHIVTIVPCSFCNGLMKYFNTFVLDYETFVSGNFKICLQKFNRELYMMPV